MKTTRNVSLDAEAWSKAQKMYPKGVSGKLNEYLVSLVNINEKDPDSIQIEIERLKLGQEEKKLSDLKLSIENRRRLIKDFEEKLAVKIEEELMAQQEEIKNASSCEYCNEREANKGIVKGKRICITCYMNL